MADSDDEKKLKEALKKEASKVKPGNGLHPILKRIQGNKKGGGKAGK